MASGTSQFANQQEVLLSVGPFQGLDATTSPYYVAPNNAVSTQNVAVNRNYASYVTAQGRVANACNGSVPNLAGVSGYTYFIGAVGVTDFGIQSSSPYDPLYPLILIYATTDVFGTYSGVFTAGPGIAPQQIPGFNGCSDAIL